MPEATNMGGPTTGKHSVGFTKGPWEAYDRRPSINDIEVSCGDSDRNGGLIMASCVGPDMVANARLIAAAPELYEALAEASKCLRLSVQSFPDAEKRALVVLAKARGEQVQS